MSDSNSDYDDDDDEDDDDDDDDDDDASSCSPRRTSQSSGMAVCLKLTPLACLKFNTCQKTLDDFNNRQK